MIARREKRPRRTVLRTYNAARAADAVGEILPGIEVYGLSKGQFSLIELVEHCLAATGPADVVISTWSAANADLAHTQGFLQDGRIRSCRWLIDFSFPSRQPAYCAQLRARFGDAAIVATANHAKFVMIRNERWNLVIRTSMNLNLNRRLESFEISDDPELADFLEEVVAATFRDGSSIADAVAAPAHAQASVGGIGGRIEYGAQVTHASEAQRGLSFEPGPRGVGYD